MTTQTIERGRAATHERTHGWLRRWVIPLLLAVVTLAVYLTTLSEVHTFDALSYIRDVNERAGFFWHPHHLLYNPTGWLFWQGWRVFGYSAGSEVPLKVLNSLAGAGCGVGLYWLVLRLTGRWWAALTAAGLLLFGYGAWYFSVEVEVYLLALIWLLAAFALLIELVTQPQPRTAPLIGIALGFAALYHQTNGLLVAVVIAGVLLSPVSWRERIRQLLWSGSLAGGIVGLGYAIIGFGVNGFRSLGQMREWMFFFIETGWWGHAVRDRWTDLGAGLGNSISTQGALPFWIAIVVTLLIGLPSAAKHWPRVVALSALWIAIYGGFFAWWEGDNIEFWIASLLPLWLLVGLSVAQIGVWRGWRPVSMTALAIPSLLLWHNYPIVQRRGDASTDWQRTLAAAVAAQTGPYDIIVSPGGVMELYLPYYQDRHNVHTINNTLFQQKGNVPAALAELGGEIDTALHAGLAMMVGLDAIELQQKFQRYPITQADLDAFWQPYKSALQPTVQFDGKTWFWRLPSANELAQGDGWRWETFSWGWQAANVTDQQFDGGWCFTPGVDPALTSPLINVDAAQYSAIEVTLQTAAPGGEAQLFFADAAGTMSDDRSVRWPLQADGALHTYTIPLADAPGWNGEITRLRLDPLPVGDGTAATRTCVQAIKLVK
jgi:4-amino-4-deoxy-L-arabinose transferase-like glycosyltransferase